MIGGYFTTFGNNKLKSNQFNHTPEVHHFHTASELKATPKWDVSDVVMGGQPLRGIDRAYTALIIGSKGIQPKTTGFCWII